MARAALHLLTIQLLVSDELTLETVTPANGRAVLIRRARCE
jgi:hypothetical protein